MSSKLPRVPVTRGIGVIVAIVAFAIAGTAAAAAKHGAKRGNTLTIGMMIPDGSLNPAAGNPGTDPVYLDPIYAPLIEESATTGKLHGVLATSWGFVGRFNKKFELSLRPGVKFSNGQAVNAAAVVASLKAYRSGTGNGATWLKPCANIRAVTKLEIRITCTSPEPDLPSVLSETALGGDIVAPASLAKPATLATDPIGAGEYVIDTAQTVVGSKYVYNANPKYFDQSAIHWRHIIVETIGNPTTGVQAVESGQIQQYFTVSPTALQAAQAAGLGLSVSPIDFQGMNLFDRNGAGHSPLANLKVREALEYAVNRKAIVQALWGKFGAVSDEVGAPSQPTTWDPSRAEKWKWSYNPSVARKLLAQAGFGNGFTLNVEVQANRATLAQAVTGYWNAIGVQTKITTDPTPTAAESSILSKQFPAAAYGYGVAPMSLEALNWFEPNANQYNPFATTTKALTSLLHKAQNAATPAEQIKGYRAVEDYGINNAWFVNVGYVKVGYVNAKTVKVPPAKGSYMGNADDVTPA